MPKAVHFQGQGEVVMRSGFGPQDTWVYLRAGPIYNGHQHDDQGNLLIEAYGGELFVENAGSGINHETVYHNSIRVAGSDQIPYGNNEVQRAQPLAGTPHERGRVTAVQTNPAYTYVATDFGNAYPDAVVPVPKSGKVTREVVVIYPDVVVVRDRVIGAGNLDVLFHVWSGAGTLDAGARTLTVARPAGRGWLKTVFPANATVQMGAAGRDGPADRQSDRIGICRRFPAPDPPVADCCRRRTDRGHADRDRYRDWSIASRPAGPPDLGGVPPRRCRAGQRERRWHSACPPAKPPDHPLILTSP